MRVFTFLLVLFLFGCENKNFENRLSQELLLKSSNAFTNKDFTNIDWNIVAKGIDWDSMAVVRGNESVPVFSDEIESYLNIDAEELSTHNDRYYFKSEFGSLKSYTINSNLGVNNLSYSILPCQSESVNRWISKKEANFLVFPMSNTLSHVGLIPACNDNYQVPDIKDYQKEFSVLGLFFDNVSLYNESVNISGLKYLSADTTKSIFLSGNIDEGDWIYNSTVNDSVSHSIRNIRISNFKPIFSKCCEFYTGEFEVGDDDYERFGDRKVLFSTSLNNYLESDSSNSISEYLTVNCHELSHLNDNIKIEKSKLDMYSLIFEVEEDLQYVRLINKENKLLLNLIEETKSGVDFTKFKSKIGVLLNLIENRRSLYPDRYNAEQYFEITEGYGRYIEYLCGCKLNEEKWSKKFDIESEYNIEDIPWMYDTQLSNGYFYITGFNKIRLLENIKKTDYRKSITGKFRYTLDDYLRDI